MLLLRLLLLFVFILFLPVAPAGTSEGYGTYGPVIGIDLGMMYSCVGIYRAGRVEIIANSQGERTTPSWVSFRDDERFVGSAAKNAFHTLPTRTIYSVKRLIGREYEDPDIQQDMAHWPFTIVRQNGRAAIQIPNQGKLELYTPEEISSMILVKMRETAEAFLGEKVTHAVVTVPAYFSDAQRQATKDAGAIAGLNILRLVNEPSAAAIAYGLDQKRPGESRVIVYDLGGGTFDVSLLSINQGIFKVLATAGDRHLGGEDFDIRLVEHFVSVYKRRFGVDVSTSQRVMAKLKKEVERAKRALSDQKTVSLEIESFYHGRDFSETLSRVKFEQLNHDLFRKTLGPVQQVLNDARLSVKDVDDIVLVGGSTRIPKIRELLKGMFEGKEPSQGINPDEAVAIGAAINAGMVSGQEELSDYGFVDVCPFTIGIETGDGDFTPFISRNTPLPSSHSKIVSTIQDNQQTVLIQVYEGENSQTKHNTFLGEFELSGIPPVVRGIAQIEVMFEVDEDSILRVAAKDMYSGNSNSITISSNRSGLSRDEIQHLTTRAEQYALDDQSRAARTDKVSALQTYLWDLNSKMNSRQFMAEMMRKAVNRTVVIETMQEMMTWLEGNEFTASLDELEQKLADLKLIVGGE